MEDDNIESIVKKIEDYSQKHPHLYKFKAFLLGILGYSYVFIMSISCLVVIIGSLLLIDFLAEDLEVSLIDTTDKWLLIPLISVIWVTLKGLCIRIYPPKGIEITKKEFKELFKSIEDIRKKLKVKKIHKVLLTEDFNVEIYQYLGLRIFDNNKSYLVIGVPLMMHLSKDEFDLIIAQKLAYISKKHSILNNWINRIRATLENIVDNIEKKKSKSKVLYKKILEVYIPYFNTYTVFLRKLHEDETNNLVTAIEGIEAKKNALLSLAIGEKMLAAEFWPQVYEDVEKNRQPPEKVYYRMKDFLYKGLTEDETIEYINKIVELDTGNINEHFSLENELENLNKDINYKKSCNIKASEEYLGESLDKFIDLFSKEWKDNLRDCFIEDYEI
ncbi:hypothetical protein CLPU_13c00240 [Gottschalkia purinilytica]|uniref:Zn-dependent protease with chaperone function n=1 Tax=Gottschalkia purinilytica TaxID=1503 RepID=A0A0L0W8A4_GOTPU|nr:hypothetical protein [Gottschalkia purinilytica]KNF07682.1 hypothetical protein CLPU_13c00240 [Gottschalkia purinilytica]